VEWKDWLGSGFVRVFVVVAGGAGNVTPRKGGKIMRSFGRLFNLGQGAPSGWFAPGISFNRDLCGGWSFRMGPAWFGSSEFVRLVSRFSWSVSRGSRVRRLSHLKREGGFHV